MLPEPELPYPHRDARKLSLREQIYLRLEQIRGYSESQEYLDSLPDYALLLSLELAVQQHRDSWHEHMAEHDRLTDNELMSL
jgi:hypothetical protein